MNIAVVRSANHRFQYGHVFPLLRGIAVLDLGDCDKNRCDFPGNIVDTVDKMGGFSWTIDEPLDECHCGEIGFRETRDDFGDVGEELAETVGVVGGIPVDLRFVVTGRVESA